MTTYLELLRARARRYLPARWLALPALVAKRTNSAALCALIVAVVYIVYLQARLAGFGYDPSRLVVAGDLYVNPSAAPAGLAIIPHSAGYDGQFYYRLALDPFTSQQSAHGIYLDNPPYRQQRILYPLVLWIVTLGHAALVPIAMILVNLLAIIGLGIFGALLAQVLGRHALWGLLLALYPGFILSIARDLPEPVAAMFLVGSLAFAARRQFIVATALLVCAILTRETVLLVGVAVLALYLAGIFLSSLRDRIPWYYAVVPLATCAAWQGFLYLRWHAIPIIAGGKGLGMPLGGFATSFAAASLLNTHGAKVTYMEFGYVLAMGAAVCAVFRLASTPGFIKSAWLLYTLLATILSAAVWVEDWAFLRALTEWYLLGGAVILGGRWWIRTPLLLLTAGLWLYLAAHRIIGP